MNKVVSRLLTFFIGLPLVIAIVFWTNFHHIGLLCFTAIAGMLTACELYGMLKNKFALQNKAFVLLMAALLPVSVILCGVSGIEADKADFIFNTVFVFSVLICWCAELIVNQTFEKSASRAATSTFIIFYSTYLLTFLARMTWLASGTAVTEAAAQDGCHAYVYAHPEVLYISFFFLVVYLNDSLAWLFGNLFGKNNKGFIKASPNKSIAGFCGGMLGSVGIGLIVFYAFPSLFGENPAAVSSSGILKIVLFSILMGFTAIFGDLVESVLKRSCEVKDSGNLVPGRGGVLDSVDSIIFAAPVFYLGIKLLYIWNW
ncbi:MAG: phosphatidate cytidylyltransferase [Treponema sp.]|nr:phosphatidate cytidylyltransferase [Treponema sp.]